MEQPSIFRRHILNFDNYTFSNLASKSSIHIKIFYGINSFASIITQSQATHLLGMSPLAVRMSKADHSKYQRHWAPNDVFYVDSTSA